MSARLLFVRLSIVATAFTEQSLGRRANRPRGRHMRQSLSTGLVVRRIYARRVRIGSCRREEVPVLAPARNCLSGGRGRRQVRPRGPVPDLAAAVPRLPVLRVGDSVIASKTMPHVNRGAPKTWVRGCPALIRVTFKVTSLDKEHFIVTDLSARSHWNKSLIHRASSKQLQSPLPYLSRCPWREPMSRHALQGHLGSACCNQLPAFAQVLHPVMRRSVPRRLCGGIMHDAATRARVSRTLSWAG